MVEEEIVNYIREQIKSGHNEESVRKHLIGYGYEIRDIDDAIDIAKGDEEIPKYDPIKDKKIKEKPPAPKKTKKETKIKEKTQKQETKQTGNIFLNMFIGWIESIYKPDQVFKSKKGKISISSGIMRILTMGALAGLISSFYTFTLLITGRYTIGAFSFTTAGSLQYAFTTISSFIEIPFTMFIGWLTLSGILYLFSALVGGKGTFSEFSGMLSIFFAPVMMIGAICSVFLPVNILLFVFLGLIAISMYPLIKAIEVTHNFETFEAMLSFLIPFLILILLLIPQYTNIFSALYSLIVG